MDPGSALGIVSLSLQVFSGCIKGYNLFIGMLDMPEKYASLRTRLRIERSRLLIWGEKVGIAEQLLSNTSQVLQLNRNLVLDILYDIHSTFQACANISSRYDELVSDNGTDSFFKQPLSRRDRLLKAVTAIGDPSRGWASLQWSLVRHDQFKGLVDTLIGYNNRVEAILDRSSLSELHKMQQTSNLMLLQLTSKVDALRDLAVAMRISGSNEKLRPSLSRQSTLVPEDDNRMMAELADFKIRYLHATLGTPNQEDLQVPWVDIEIEKVESSDSQGTGWYKGRHVWVEWRESAQYDSSQLTLHAQLRSRVAGLVSLLGAEDKPAALRTPHCLGYTQQQKGSLNDIRYGLVFDGPLHSSGDKLPVSLRELFTYRIPSPSLSDRIALAKTLAESVFYLHAVDWVHKGIRSQGVLLLGSPDQHGVFQYIWEEPLISGFELSRPDSTEEQTFCLPSSFSQDLYRHPNLLKDPDSRCDKSHDIYSLGVVMAELAFWQPIEHLMQIKKGEKGSHREVKRIRERLLHSDFSRSLEMTAGTKFATVVRACIGGLIAQAGDEDGLSYTGEDGVMIQQAFREQVLSALQAIHI